MLISRCKPINRLLPKRWTHATKQPPDNVPTLEDNERWLRQLGSVPQEDTPPYPDITLSRTRPGKNKFSLYTPAKKFEYEIIDSKGKYKKELKLKSSLSNFSSLNYLKQFSNNNNQHSVRNTGINGNFQDTKIIHCKSGKGGDGFISFLRDANRRIGPPNGGDGGDGGSIYVQAISGMNSLSKLKSLYVAPNGSSGQSDQLDGARGEDILVKVPLGTTIRWCLDPKLVRSKLQQIYQSKTGIDTSLSLRDILQQEQIMLNCIQGDASYPPQIRLTRDVDSNDGLNSWLFKDKTLEYHLQKQWFNEFNEKMKQYDRNLLYGERDRDVFPLYGIDLDINIDNQHNGMFKLLDGGQGGLGNMHFLTSMIRNPRFAKRGRPGLEGWFLFELKIIADIGLIGLPNAGKSTILNKISNARPRIGHWEFTTLTPSIGTVKNSTRQEMSHSTFTVADIPGIIKDAHLDRGMGLEFIKHIERSRCWCFVLSLDREDPLQDFDTLIEEVGGIERVQLKNVLIVANKADLSDSTKGMAQYQRLASFCHAKNWDILPISASENHNIDLLVHKMGQCLE